MTDITCRQRVAARARTCDIGAIRSRAIAILPLISV
jgi:hypothetical protein